MANCEYSYLFEFRLLFISYFMIYLCQNYIDIIQNILVTGGFQYLRQQELH